MTSLKSGGEIVTGFYKEVFGQNGHANSAILVKDLPPLTLANMPRGRENLALRLRIEAATTRRYPVDTVIRDSIVDELNALEW